MQRTENSQDGEDLDSSQRRRASAMAEATVEFLLENLKQLLSDHTHRMKDFKNEMEKLERDLRLFKAFLKDSTKDEKLGELIRQVHNVVYEAEDIVDGFVTQAAENKSKSYFLTVFYNKPVKLEKKLLGIAEQVEDVVAKARDIYGDKSKIDFASLDVGDDGPEETEEPVVRKDHVVGFEDETVKIKGYIREGIENLDVISIIGIPGLGKTTLARKIFHDPDIQYEYPSRIWVYVSQDFSNLEEEYLLNILREFTNITDDMHKSSDQELAQQVATHLESGKFLIVMDDVWTNEDWDKLQIAFPKSNKAGKILITSRHAEVAQHANRCRLQHKLRFLTHEESWLLLQLEVFGKAGWPPELEVHGKLITEQCGYLPLAIVVIGGILVKKSSTSDESSTRTNAWRRVSENVSPYLNEDPQGRMEKIIALSYDKLPYHLRACFLYLGMFPEDFEIAAWKLIRMWIAEGFIKQNDNISLEETAENYLEDLINRDLVRIDKMRSDGRVKSCRIHDMLREFCKNEAGNESENFLQEVKKNGGVFQPPIDDLKKYRRLCIHSDVSGFLSWKPFGHRVRSFVCFSKEEIPVKPENMSDIFSAFKLLRVLEAKPIKFTKYLGDMFRLVHLRYITLSLIDLKILPSAFSKIWNVQTLVVDTTHRTLEIKADIWQMIQLRHFKTNASATLPTKAGKSSEGGEKLQSLGTISPQSCRKEVFETAKNLKSLGIRGRLALLLDEKFQSFGSLGKLTSLEKLKLLNDVLSSPLSEGQLRGLPQPYMFPPKLRSLTLSDTFLNWAHMSIIGLLENLVVLKLKDKAFMGKSWEAADGGFRHHEILQIGRTDLVVWKASGHHFPRLKCLELRNCEELQEIPVEIADISTLEVLDVYCSRFTGPSAKRIREAIKKNREESKVGVFRLCIFPPDE